MSKKGVYYTLGSIGIVATLMFGFGVFQNVQANNKLQVQNKALKKDLANAKSEYKKKVSDVDAKAYQEAINSKDETVKSIATHNGDYAIVNNIADKFFKTYFSWKDTKTYLARSTELLSEGVITSSLANDKNTFDSGKDSTGNDYIKTTGIKSSFDSADAYLAEDMGSTINALVKVVNTASYKSGNSGEATHYYQITYDRNSKEITAVKLVLTV